MPWLRVGQINLCTLPVMPPILPTKRGPFHGLQRALPLCVCLSHDSPFDTQVLLQRTR